MKWAKEGYLGTIVGSEPSVAHTKARWVTCFVNAIRIELSEEMQWWNIPLAPVSTFTQNEAIPLLLAEADRQTVVYASLVWGAQTSSRKISSHGGSSVWTPMRSAFFPFFPCCPLE